MDGMSYVYVYIYTLYTGAKVCVYVYAVSEEGSARTVTAPSGVTNHPLDHYTRI